VKKQNKLSENGKMFTDEPTMTDDEALLSDDDVTLPMFVVDLLIKRFAYGNGAKLKRRYDDLSSLKSKVHGGERVIHTGAVYNPATMTMLISVRKKRFEDAVHDVLHEIQHFNQHMSWILDKNFKKEFVQGPQRERPLEKLTDLSFIDLLNYFIRDYGYEEAPHEIDASFFADDNMDEALDFIIDQLKEYE
jgi:hypothetical protein